MLLDRISDAQLDQWEQEPCLPEAAAIAQGSSTASSLANSPESPPQIAQPQRSAEQEKALVAWRKYVESEWRPWAEQMRRWKATQDVYSTVDFM